MIPRAHELVRRCGYGARQPDAVAGPRDAAPAPGRRDEDAAPGRRDAAPAPGPIDTALADLAAVHGLDACLGARIADGDLAATTPEVAHRLVGAHRRSVGQMLALGLEAESVARRLDDAGIPVMAIKGFAVAHLAYRRPEERTMVDLDVLVGPEDHAAACRALLDEAPDRTRIDDATGHFGRQVVSRRRIAVDVHRALANRPMFETPHAALFARARPGPHGLLHPDPNDLMVILAIHHARNGTEGPLRVVVDGLALAALPEVTPAAVIARAAEMHARRATGAWIFMLLGFGLDGDGWAEAAERLLGGDWLIRTVAEGPRMPGSRALRVARSLWLTDGIRRRAGWLARRLLPH